MKKYLAILVLLSLSFALTACGGGGNAPTTTVNVTMTDFQFTPNEFTVPAGQEITVNAANNGAVIHNFVVMKYGANVGDAWDDSDTPNIYWEVEVQPGGSAQTSFTAPTEPGDYEVVCRTPGHIVSGMVAKLRVVADE